MPFRLEPEIAVAIDKLVEDNAGRPVPSRGDWKAVRETANRNLAAWANAMPSYEDVAQAEFTARAGDGFPIALRWYERVGSKPGSGIVYAHGGGMIAGNLDVYDSVIAQYVHATGTPFLSVDYRLAPEVKGPIPSLDAFAAIEWLHQHASELGVDANRIAVMGDSGGGGVIAGAAIEARYREVPLARQILIYPMLDDRNITPDPLLQAFATWSYDSNYTAWSARLGERFGTEAVEPVTAPARLTDFRNLAPAYIEVGELDIFRNESISYAERLAQSGIPIELRVHPGAPHGFDRLAPNCGLVQRTISDRLRIIRSI